MKVSSPEPPVRLRLPAALAAILIAVVNESPVADEAVIVDVAPG